MANSLKPQHAQFSFMEAKHILEQAVISTVTFSIAKCQKCLKDYTRKAIAI